MNDFIRAITSDVAAERDRPFPSICASLPDADLLPALQELDAFRRGADNLYERVRATQFLYAAHRFIVPRRPGIARAGLIPYDGVAAILERHFGQAVDEFLAYADTHGFSAPLCSALAEAYHQLAFQSLTDQVRRSVRATRGNQWMFRIGHPDDCPVRVTPALLSKPESSRFYSILVERTPVRLDLSHSGWSDIFFLGMDYPEGARVLNISVDLGVYGRDAHTAPPITTHVRIIQEPLLRLTSVDLQCTKDIRDLRELFSFGSDYLGLLKAGVIASGTIPPCFEGTHHTLQRLLERIVGPGCGLELATSVNDIPKGSRLAVSTNLLASIVTALMRATGQIGTLEGRLEEHERRLVASRAILGEWLGGSGGGWQDSGGIWPGLKIIEGVAAAEGDPEFGISRGRLLPRHRVLGHGDLHPEIRTRLAESLVLIHGGLAQDVGPILEMVTEKYLLRGEREWAARLRMRDVFDRILKALRSGDVRELARCTTENFASPLRAVIPWVTNRFTEEIIRRAATRCGDDFWGFLMLGGMSGGGMAMFCAPERHSEFRDGILDIMRATKSELEAALPFAIEPVVYDFQVNDVGTCSQIRHGDDAVMPASYHSIHVPELVRQSPSEVPPLRPAELEQFIAGCSDHEQTHALLQTFVRRLFQVSGSVSRADRELWDAEAERLKQQFGFDAVQHEQLRADLQHGRTGLAHNRLPVETSIADVDDGDVVSLAACGAYEQHGIDALKEGRVAVVSLAGGVGTRWTGGAGVIKAINPFVMLQGRHRSFLELHLAKTAHVAESYGAAIPHVVTTSFLTHEPVALALAQSGNYGYAGPVYLSPGRSIGHRIVPMVRDLAFLWEETSQEVLDEQKEKVRASIREALMGWARDRGEGGDYVDNEPLQRFHPPGHWYEIPNMLRNGTLARLLKERPAVETLMIHNIDTCGVALEPAALGYHLARRPMMTFEVIARWVGDRGGGLARVNGRLRLVEGLAMPREEAEYGLRYYNSSTCWVQIDALLGLFGLTREDLAGHEDRIAEAVRGLAARLPSYVTIKDVKRRWGHGQEDVYPVAQFEKLWGDMTALPDVACAYLHVPRMRGQQLKEPSELDPWANDGSIDYVAELCGDKLCGHG